ncbi:MAG: DUF4340 domain-containing protein [Gammaproteobacteria bacterium]
MNRRSFLILVAVVLVMVGLLYTQPNDVRQRQQQRILPGLSAVLNDVEKVTVVGAGNEAIATLQRGDPFWTLAERDGYRADVGRIRRNLIALSEARVLEQKTTDPALHARLGVEDLADADATGREFIIEAPSGSFRLIVGNTDVRGGMAYVRRPDAAQSFLVSARLDPGDSTIDWLERDLLDIEAGRIHSVTVTHPDGEVLRIEKATREADAFTLADMPQGRELQYPTVLNPMSTLLAGLTIDDVAVAADVDEGDAAPVLVRFETFDGLVIEVRIAEADGEPRAGFTAVADEALAAEFAAPDAAGGRPGDGLSVAAVNEEAQRLNEKFGGWSYTLPSFKTDQLTRRLEDVLKPAE